MRIGFDAKRAFHNKTGLGNYSRSLIELMQRFYPENQYYLFNPKPSNLYKSEGVSTQELFPQHKLAKKLSSFWRTFLLSKIVERLHLDIFHGLSHELPFGIRNTETKWIVTVHDLIFLRFPQYFNPIDRFIYRYKIIYACKKADRIIAISEQTKRDLIDYLNISAGKIDVVYQGCHPVFKQHVDAEQKEKIVKQYNLPSTFLLQVGTIEQRKNLILSIKALTYVPTDVVLVVVGRPTTYLNDVKKEIDDLALQHRVRFLHNVPFEDLPVLYHLASVFLYPSRFEGFGIPIIEALNCGVPVIAATGSCLEEAGGAESLYVHPDDDEQLAEYIKLILENSSQREKMIYAGKAYVDRFSDPEIAKHLIAVYRKTLDNSLDKIKSKKS